MRKFLVFQWHGTAVPGGSLEWLLHLSGKPLVSGFDRFHDADYIQLWEERKYRDIYKQCNRGSLEGFDGETDMLDSHEATVTPDEGAFGDKRWGHTFQKQHMPLPGPYEHLSWCFMQKGWSEPEPSPAPKAVLQYILQQDPEINILLWACRPHDCMKEALTWLQRQYRQRHVSVFHKLGDGDYYKRTGSYEDEDIRSGFFDAEKEAFWSSDLGFVNGLARISPRSKYFSRQRGATKHSILRALHSGLSQDDFRGILLTADKLLDKIQGVTQ